jgi:acyl-CoA synthetase (AMP-forming)/AMP-acid ligase II
MDIGRYLALNARRHPDKLALAFEEREYTYSRLNQMVNRFAHGLLRLGVKKGEKVALMLKNSDFFPICYYAAAKIGAVLVPMNFRLVAREINYILEQSDSVVVICDEEYGSIIEEARKGISAVRQVISVGKAMVSGHLSFNEVLSDLDHEPGVEVNGDDDLQIMYTSGTTGRPKGAVFDHQRVIKVAISSLGTLGVCADDRLINIAPLFHAAQLCIILLPGFFVGAFHVIHRDFNPGEVLKAIDKYKISVFFGVPTMYNMFLQLPNASQYDFSSIRCCAYGAAPMNKEIVRQSMELFKTKRFFSLCGLTEGGPNGIYLTPEDHKTKIGASGKTSLLFIEARVVNENGEDTAPGVPGELILRGETVMKEYYKKPEETADTIRNYWLHTGDLAVKDNNGYITLIDRIKDMIIPGGENVYSVEVEQVLNGHPQVLESAIIGTPDPKWGEKVTAIVLAKPGENIVVEDLQAYCRQHLAGYKIPRKVIFVDVLPRNASGKLLKYELRDKYKNS